MTAAARPRPLRSGSFRGRAVALVISFGSLAANAEPLSSTLPQTIHRGQPPGRAISRGSDWSRSRRGELPAPGRATVLWQRRISGGLHGDVLVDDAGSIFVTGQGRVMQLSSDGRNEFTRRAEFSSAAASALLADGQRVVLSREGSLAAWSRRGRATFQRELPLPPGWARGDLLPLPDGSVLVSAGVYLLRVSANGELEGDARLDEAAAETLVSGHQLWVITEHGKILAWDGRSPPVKRGSFAGQVSAAAAGAPGQLLAVVEGRELMQWRLGAEQQPSTLCKLEGLGNGARMSIPTNAVANVLGASGAFFSVSLEVPAGLDSLPESHRLPAGPGQLLSSADTVAWFIANAPLTLWRRAGTEQPLSEVTCLQPSSLSPAGPERFIAACQSGQLWLIGPAASSSDAGQPPSEGAAPVLP